MRVVFRIWRCFKFNAFGKRAASWKHLSGSDVRNCSMWVPGPGCEGSGQRLLGWVGPGCEGLLLGLWWTGLEKNALCTWAGKTLQDRCCLLVLNLPGIIRWYFPPKQGSHRGTPAFTLWSWLKSLSREGLPGAVFIRVWSQGKSVGASYIVNSTSGPSPTRHPSRQQLFAAITSSATVWYPWCENWEGRWACP